LTILPKEKFNCLIQVSIYDLKLAGLYNISRSILGRSTDVADNGRFKVGECLNLLHLDAYVDQFHRMDVDGQLLVSLSAQVLTSDFNFSQFEAIKLMKFAVDGWRPLKRSTTP